MSTRTHESACSTWYPALAAALHATPKATLLECCDAFSQYLLADGFVLPPSFRDSRSAGSSSSDDSDSDNDNDGGEGHGGDAAASSSCQAHDFPELAAAIQARVSQQHPPAPQ
jgi:hypothetical protein